MTTTDLTRVNVESFMKSINNGFTARSLFLQKAELFVIETYPTHIYFWFSEEKNQTTPLFRAERRSIISLHLAKSVEYGSIIKYAGCEFQVFWNHEHNCQDVKRL